MLIARTDDDFEFHLSQEMLPATLETFTKGQKLVIRFEGLLAPKVLQVELAGS